MSGSASKAASNILKTMRASYGSGSHTRVAVDEGEFPYLDLEGYRAFRQELEAQGFRHLADYEVIEVTKAHADTLERTFARGMVSRDGQVLATYYQVKRRGSKAITRCADLETEFDDGRFVVTSSAQSAGMLSGPPQIDSQFFPQDTPLDVLSNAHFKRLVGVLKQGGAKPRVVGSMEEMSQSQDRMASLKAAHRAGAQWITPQELSALSGGNAEVTGAVYSEIVKQRRAGGGAGNGSGAGNGGGIGNGGGPGRGGDDGPIPRPKGILRHSSLFVILMILSGFLPRRIGEWLSSRMMKGMMQQSMAYVEQIDQYSKVRAARIPIAPVEQRTVEIPGRKVVFEREPTRLELASEQDLPSWSGYACDNSHPELTGSRVRLRLQSGDDNPEPLQEPVPGHLNAVQWLFAHEQQMHDAVLASLEKYAPALRERLAEFGEDELIAHTKTRQGWQKLVDLSYIDIFPLTRDGMPYYSFEFECAWDPEHGFKVLMNGTRMAAIDDDGYTAGDCERDGGLVAA